MPKRVINDQTKKIAENLRNLAQGVDKSGLPEGSEGIINDIMDMVVMIASDTAVAGALICIAAVGEKGGHEATQGTFVMSKAGVSVYYELMGRLQAIADGIGRRALVLDEAINEAGEQKKKGGIN